MLVDWSNARTISATLGHAASLPEHTHGKLTIEMLNQLPVNHSLAGRYLEAVRGGPVRPWPPSDLSLELVFSPQPARNFAKAGGHWAIYSTFPANMHVGLLNMF